MNKLLFIFCVITLFSCGSKKKFNKVDSVENIKSTEQLYATRDSAGNERIETDMDFSKKTEENNQDTTKIASSRQENAEKVVDQESEEERSGVMEYWVWITGVVAVIIIALVVGICVIKR